MRKNVGLLIDMFNADFFYIQKVNIYKLFYELENFAAQTPLCQICRFLCELEPYNIPAAQDPFSNIAKSYYFTPPYYTGASTVQLVI